MPLWQSIQVFSRVNRKRRCASMRRFCDVVSFAPGVEFDIVDPGSTTQRKSNFAKRATIIRSQNENLHKLNLIQGLVLLADYIGHRVYEVAISGTPGNILVI